MKKPCCGGRARSFNPNPRDFCQSLSLATPVTIEQHGQDIVLMVLTPGGQSMKLGEALAHFKCQGAASTGARAATLVLSAFNRAVAKGRVASLPVGRKYPMLMLKDKLFALVEPCTQCKGGGCGLCGETGFKN